MKIIVLGPVAPLRGGIAAYTTLLVKELAQRHTVQVLSFRRQYPAWLYPGRTDRDPGMPPVSVPVDERLDTLNPLTWLQAARWVVEQKPDLLILQWWVTFMAPAYRIIASRARRAGVRVLYTIHNVLPHERHSLDPFLARLALSQGQGFLVHAAPQQELLLELLPGAVVQRCPFPPYADLLPASPALSRTEARQALGLPMQAPVLLFFGIVRPYKGLMVLLEAAARLHTEGLPVHVLAAGEFWEPLQAYQAAVQRLGLSEFVHLHDRYIPGEELVDYFAAADLAVFPYTAGTQSAAAALALAHGLPLVLTERSAAGMHPDELDPQAVAAAGDGISLANAIRYRLQTPERRAPAGRSGWEQVLDSIDHLALSLS